MLFIQRICSDWDASPPSQRKALTTKEAVAIHQQCAMILHFLDCLEARLPSAEFPAAKSKLMAAFLLGGLDPELTMAAEQSVPPGDMKAIGAFR